MRLNVFLCLILFFLSPSFCYSSFTSDYKITVSATPIVYPAVAQTPSITITPVSRLSDKQFEALLKGGLDETFNMHYDKGLTLFGNAIAARSERMEGYFGEILVLWEKLQDDKENSEVEKTFKQKVLSLIERGKKLESSHPGNAELAFFMGDANGCLALLSLWNQDWFDAFFRSGDAVSRLRKAVKLDPNLYDAYLGLGIYEYYIDALPIIMKLFGWMITPGNREEGIKYLNLVAEKGHYGKVMAKVFLAEGLGLYEGDYKKAAEIYEELIRSYPDNYRFILNRALVTSFIDPEKAGIYFKEIVAQTEAGKPATFRKEMLPFIHIMLGNLSRLKKDYESALQEYERCLSAADAKPRFVTWCHVEKARTLDLMLKREEALKSYRQALNLPDFKGAHAEAHSGINQPFDGKDLAKKNIDTTFSLLSLPRKE